MNQRMPGPRVVRPRRGAPAPDFAAYQDTPTAEAAQSRALEQARLNAGVPESPPHVIQLDPVRVDLRAPRVREMPVQEFAQLSPREREQFIRNEARASGVSPSDVPRQPATAQDIEVYQNMVREGAYDGDLGSGPVRPRMRRAPYATSGATPQARGVSQVSELLGRDTPHDRQQQFREQYRQDAFMRGQQAAMEAAMEASRRSPEGQALARAQQSPSNTQFTVEQLRAQGLSEAELVQLGRARGPSDATADELRAQGYGEPYIAGHASDIRTPAQVRTAAGEIRRLSAMTPALPDGVPHQRHAPVVRRGALDIPATPMQDPTADSVNGGYAVRDGALIPRARPVQVPEGYAVTQDGQVLPRAEPVPMSFVPTEQGGPTQSDLSPQDYAAMRSQGPAMTQGPNMSSDPSLYRSMPQGQGAAAEDNATMPVPIYDGGEITIDAGMYPADENGFPLAPQPQQRAPRPNVPRRRHAPYVAGLPNAPGGTAEMPSALQPPTAWPERPAVARRTPLDTQMDTLGLNVQYAMSRAEDAQDAGQRIADIEIARQRRMNENQMDRERAEGRARDAVQRAADRAASIRIDPSRAMQGASGIANVIAVVLGGIGSGITGGPNQPLALVQQNIERDLAAQRTDLDTARNAVADQQSILGNVRQEFQSREAADNAFREFALRQAAAETEVQAQRANFAEARDRAANLREQLVNAADQARVAAERAEMTQLLAFDRSRAETGLFDARTRATLATASGTEAANARRALMASRGRAPYGSWAEWTRLTPAQQATRMQNAQDAQLTGTPLADALALSGVPSGGLQGERAPVENGARAGAGGAPEQIDAMELGRRLTNANTMMQSGVDAATANERAGLPPGTLERQAVAPEQVLRLAAADNALRTLEGAIARARVDGNGIAGVGWWDNNVPGAFSSDEALQNRIAIAGAIDSFIRVSSGANAPESEVQRQRDMVIGDGTERALIAGVQYLRGQLDAQLGNTASIGTDVGAQDALAAQLGVAPRAEAPEPAPTPSAPARQRAPLLRARSSGSGRNLE